MKQRTALFLMRGATMVMGIVLLRLLGHALASEEYDIFIISKQIIGWFVAFSFMGMATALPRTIVANSELKSAEGIYLSAMFLIVPSILLLVIAAWLFPDAIAVVVFKDAQWSRMIAPLALLTACIATMSMLNLYYRGVNKFSAAMGLELVSQGIVPVGLVLLIHHTISLARYLYYYIIILCALGAVLMFWLLWASDKVELFKSLRRSSEIIKQLLNYGMPKLMSGVYLMFILGLIPVALRWSGATLNQAAASGLGVSLGVTVSAILLTINSTLTFNDIVYYYVNDREKCARAVGTLVQLALVVGSGLIFIGLAGTDVIVHYLIGPMYDGNAMFLNIGAAIGFSYYVIGVLEIPLDAIKPPWNKASASALMLVGTILSFFMMSAYGLLSPQLCVIMICMAQLLYAIILTKMAMKTTRGMVFPRAEIMWKLALSIVFLAVLLIVRLYIDSPVVHLVSIVFTAMLALFILYGMPYISMIFGIHRAEQ